jgi:hypothetical protein
MSCERTPAGWVVIIGRLAARPTVRATAGGDRMAVLRIVTTCGQLDAADDALEYELIAFDQLAERASEMARGRLIYAEGHLQAGEDADPAVFLHRLTSLAPTWPAEVPPA